MGDSPARSTKGCCPWQTAQLGRITFGEVTVTKNNP